MLLRKKLEERRRAMESTFESTRSADRDDNEDESVVQDLTEWRSLPIRTSIDVTAKDTETDNNFADLHVTPVGQLTSVEHHDNVQDVEVNGQDGTGGNNIDAISPRGPDHKEVTANKLRSKIRERLRRTRTSELDVPLPPSLPPHSVQSPSSVISKRRTPTSKVAPTVDEANLFFTSDHLTWSPKHHIELDRPETREESTAISDETKLLIGDVLEIGNNFLEPSRFSGAIYRPLHQRTAQESVALFQPSSAQVPLLQKLPENVQPRNLEDEGFYVGCRPYLPPRVSNKIEQRLVQNKSVHWFAEDGGILALPDPRVMTSSRGKFEFDGHSQADTETSAAPNTVFRKARLGLSDSQEIWETSRKFFQLDFNVLRISFTHHPLFSKEHVIASKLTQLFEQHTAAQSQRLWEHFSDRLVALRAAVMNIKDLAEKNQQISSDKAKKLAAYKAEIRQLREQKYLVGVANVKLRKAILNSWRQLKLVRQSQGYTSTGIKLRILRQEADQRADEELFNVDFETELNELKEEHLDKYEGSSDRGAEAHVIPKINFTSVSDELRQRMSESRRQPGEPLLSFELLNTTPITATEQCPKNEQRRRQAVQRSQIYLRIIFNGKPVDNTVARCLSSDFCVSIHEVFHLKIYHVPRSLSVQVFESESLHSSEMLAQMFIPIPSSKRTSRHVHEDELEFSGDTMKTFGHEGVGSGVSVEFGELDDGKPSQLLMTSGVMKYSASWALDEDGNVLAPENVRSNIVSNYNQGKSYTSSVDKITQWLDEGNLDPNDPRNAELISQLKMSTHGMAQFDHFRLNPLQKVFDFVDDDVINCNRRFKMLLLRSEEVPEFVGYRMVPLRERDIPLEAFDAYEKRLREDAHAQLKSKESSVDTVRKKGACALKKLKQVVLDQCRLAERHKTLDEVVAEEQVLDIGTLGLTLAHLTKRRRPLRPERRERRKITSLSLGVTHVHLLVNVACAFNVPVRTDAQVNSGRDGSNFNEPHVRPFVEVSFQRQTARTGVSHGPSPRWNHDLQFEFRPPEGSFVTDNLQSVRDALYLHLMDEVVVDLVEDDRERESFVHQRLDRRWLGSLCIPFSTIYLNTRLEGTFRMTSPPILLGYEREGRSLGQGAVATSADPFNMHSDKDHTYISIFVTLEPTLPLPEPVALKLASLESEGLLAEVERWKEGLKVRFPNRDVRVLVTESTGKTALVVRFIQPLAPPDALVSLFPGMKNRQVMELLARFVSLIPTEADAMILPGTAEIWVPSNQFLEMLVGGPEEHAILLCNFFLHLGKKSYILLGSAVPEGKTAYVLTADDAFQFTLWNASTGYHFFTTDALNPLTRVDCMFNQNNIWFNVQPHVTTPQMSFDVDVAKHWLPLFSKSLPNPGLQCIQPEVLDFTPVDEQLAEKVSETVEQALRSQVMLWRRHLRTVWNRHCSRILKSILHKLERSRYEAVIRDELSVELQTIRTSYKLCGFPLDMAYVSIEAVVDAVYSTGVHRADAKDVEFALAVHAHSYPGNIMAIWVYIASLSKR